MLIVVNKKNLFHCIIPKLYFKAFRQARKRGSQTKHGPSAIFPHEEILSCFLHRNNWNYFHFGNFSLPMAAACSSVMGCGGESTFAKSIDIWDCFCKCDGVGIIIKIQFSLGHRPRQLSLRHDEKYPHHVSEHYLPHFVNITWCIFI